MSHDMPNAYRMNAEACGDDPRNWGFVRNTNLPRHTFARDPMAVFVRYRGWVLVAGIVVLILIALTGADIASW